MIKSMTGYGRAQKDTGKKLVTIEIRSVNHRFFDFSVRTPRTYNFLEEPIKNIVAKQIKRGRTDVFLSVEDKGNSPAKIKVNHSLVSGYLEMFKGLSIKYKIKNDITVSSLTQYKDLFCVDNAEDDTDSFTKTVLDTALLALDSLSDMRFAEGQRLSEDILNNCQAILSIVEKIEARSPVTVAEYRQRLLARMKEVLEGAGIEEQRILLEAAVFADKVTVNEETVRLKSHISELMSMLSNEDAVGKKLDFIVQEMNREINTIGSKANDLAISHLVVDAKAKIENIREQVQNIE